MRRLAYLFASLSIACVPAELRLTEPDGGGHDSGIAADAGNDAGSPDAGSPDAGPPDAGPPDAGLPDAGFPDAGLPDAGFPDAGTPVDAGVDAGQCVTPPSPASDVDPWSVRLPSSGFGGTLAQTTGTHRDVFLKSPSPADYTRIGVRLDWGGTVVFWGLSANAASNTIDANDTGRELQLALYDPARNRQSCAHNATCLTTTSTCGNSITFLGWDPVQGGDECNRGASATSSVINTDTLRVVVTPVQWNPDWDAIDCRSTACTGAALPAQVQYVMDLRFVHSLVVEASLEVQSLETIDHGITAQEFPTLYVAHGSGGPDLATLLDSDGGVVTIDVPANDGFLVKNFSSPRPWVSFQNALRDYGVGLASDQGLTSYQGWRGDGTTAPYFHNVRSNLAFGLSHGAIVRGRTYLALGSFSTIDTVLTSLLAQRPPFGVVDAPAQGTLARGAITVSGWVLDTAHLTSVRLEVDGALVTTLPVNTARPDVCALYPGYAGCPSVGFSGVLPTGGLDACVHLLKVVAVDDDGNRTVLGERLVQR